MSGPEPMRDLLLFAVRSLAGEPDAVQLAEETDGRHHRFQLSLAPADAALLQEDGGRLAEAIRTVLDACAWKHHQRVRIEIPGDGSGPSSG